MLTKKSIMCSTSQKELRMKRILFLTVTGIMLLSFVCPIARAQKKRIQVGDTMPGFFLKDIRGESFFLKDYIGEKAKFKHKAMIFSLSASWCKPCKKEIPELGKMTEKYKEKGLGIFIIALEKEENARDLIKETQTKIPVLLDRYLMVPKLLGQQGIPFTLLVDDKGIVRYINTGFSEENAAQFIERFENAVTAVLGIDDDGTSE